jgi:IS1 family transposase
MNVLQNDKQVAIIAALTEGVSIRATERLTNVHRDTIMRLGVRIGEGCAALHDRTMVNLQIGRVELDEAWSYVGKKQRKLTPTDSTDKGDQYVFLALEGAHKAILSYAIGKRDMETTNISMSDLRQRIINQPTINTDAFGTYPDAVARHFGRGVHYGQIIKSYAGEPSKDAARTAPRNAW